MRLVTGDPDLADFRVAEYGTRRRFSKVRHEEVLVTMKAQMGVHFAGPSNVTLAMQHGVTPLGTKGARKRVVLGKSVSIRADIGGRRTMTKKIVAVSYTTQNTSAHVITKQHNTQKPQRA